MYLFMSKSKTFMLLRHAAMELTSHCTVPGAMKVAIELGVFEILAKAGAAGQKSLTAKEINC